MPGHIGFWGLGVRPPHVASRATQNRAQLQPGPPRSHWGEQLLGLIHCRTKVTHDGICDVLKDVQRGTHPLHLWLFYSIYLFLWLCRVLVEACGIFSLGMGSPVVACGV